MFRSTNHLLISALMVTALSAPAAAKAMPISDGAGIAPQRISTQQLRLDQLQRNVHGRFEAEGGWPATAASLPPVGHSAPDGLQWADVGIGAAGTAMLLGAGAVASGAARRRRTFRTAIG